MRGERVNRLVLIADGNATRGRSLAEACERAGVPCKTGPHGAAALEIALSDRPGLVVAHADLPLVDAEKLAEILRANPRTSRSRFLFVGGETDHASPAGPCDVLMPESSATRDIVSVIEGLVARQERLEALEVATTSGEVTTGDLGPVVLSDLVTLFQATRASGRLDLATAGARPGAPPETGLVFLRDGDVLQAETGRASNEKAFFRMLAWRTGKFRLQPGTVDEPAFLATTTRVLLQEGTRQLEEWDRHSTALPQTDSPVHVKVKRSELPNIVHPLTHEVMLLLELYGVVRDVVDHCSFPDYQVLRTLQTLADREIIELGQVPVPPAPAVDRPEAEPLFNEIQVRRLREWVDAGTARSGAGGSAKLLVASSDAAATPDFAQLFRGIPGATLSKEAERGEIGPNDLVPIGSLQVVDGLQIDLLHVPRSESFSPVWSLAGHRALGTLFLMGGGVGSSAEALAPMCASLSELPRARTFHVVVLRKGERVSTDELHENLSLIDEASMFLLPLESRKDPAVLMRGLFARVVP